jgi:putative flippase GtrA
LEHGTGISHKGFGALLQDDFVMAPTDHVRALVRYVAVGVTQNGLFYAAILVLIWLGMKAWQATIILYPIAAVISFAANRAWSFADRARHGTQFRKYVFLYVAVYPCAVALNWVQEHVGVPSWLASLATLLAAAGGMFLALNYWVFRR